MARVQGNNSYRAKLSYASGGALDAHPRPLRHGTETTLATANVAGITATAGLPIRLRFEVEGTSPTTLRAKVWPADATEPAAWSVTTTDTTAGLQTPGQRGLDLYTSSSATAARGADLRPVHGVAARHPAAGQRDSRPP